jgi:trehalose-6-phosphatase
MRYFRATSAVYADICATLDAAYGYPNAATKTDRTLPLASELASDSQGRVYLVVSEDVCEYVLPSQMLPELLASGAVEEITPEAYAALFPRRSTP